MNNIDMLDRHIVSNGSSITGGLGRSFAEICIWATFELFLGPGPTASRGNSMLGKSHRREKDLTWKLLAIERLTLDASDRSSLGKAKDLNVHDHDRCRI